jgi:hypothetical protein
MFEYPPFKQFLASVSARRVQRIHTQMGAFGMPAVAASKDTILLGTAPYLGELARRMTPSDQDALASRRGRISELRPTYGRFGVNVRTAVEVVNPARFGVAHALAFKACDRDRKLNAAAACDSSVDNVCAAAAAAAEAAAPLASAAAAAAAHDTLAPYVPPAAAAAAADAAAADWADAAVRNFDPDVDEDTWYLQDIDYWDSTHWKGQRLRPSSSWRS